MFYDSNILWIKAAMDLHGPIPRATESNDPKAGPNAWSMLNISKKIAQVGPV